MSQKDWKEIFRESLRTKSDVDSFLASVMKYLNTKASTQLIEHAKSVCLYGMESVYQVLGDEAFRFKPKAGGNKRPVNMGLFEMLVFAFCYVQPNQLDHSKAKSLVDTYKQNVDDEGLFSGSIDTSENVRARFDTAQKITQGLKNA